MSILGSRHTFYNQELQMTDMYWVIATHAQPLEFSELFIIHNHGCVFVHSSVDSSVVSPVILSATC